MNQEEPSVRRIALEAVLCPSRIRMLSTARKDAVLDALIEALSAAPEVGEPQALAAAIRERERLMSTGIGLGLAVPHARLASVTDLVMAAAVSDCDITDYGSLDGKPVRMVFLVAARADQHAAYLRLLALLSTRLKDAALRAALLAAPDPETVHRLLTGG